MIKKITLMASAAALLFSQPVWSQHSLNLRDVDIRAFVQDVQRVTGRTFIVDGRVNAKISVVSDRSLSRSEYFEIFLSTLRANDLIAIPTSDGSYRIQPAESAASQPTKVGASKSSNNQFVTEVVRLKSIEASEAIETLLPLISKQGSLTANRNANSLVIADYADNIKRIRELLSQIDRDNASTNIVTLNNAGAREIATSLQSLVAVGEGAKAPVTVVAIDSSNSIVLRGDQSNVTRFSALARELDVRAKSGTELRVYKLDYADSEQILPVIERLLGQFASTSDTSSGNSPAASAGGGDSAAPSAPPAAITSGDSGGSISARGPAIATRYAETNSIIIAANADTQRMIGELIRQLDVRQQQVVVEAIIVEISDSLAKELGVQVLFGGENAPFAVTNFSNAAPNIVDIAGGILADEFNRDTTIVTDTSTSTSTNSAVTDQLETNAAQSILSARGAFTGFATSLGGNVILGALINAVQQDTESNILSTPSITVNNNFKGDILFGQEIPVSTGEALSGNFDNAFRTIQRQNVGIELEVTPQINADQEIRLQLRQQVSSIAGPVSDDFNELIINKREINTTVTVGDQEILALGGLLDDNERRTIQKIPFLGDLPLIGKLFRSKAESRVKTNLMVFIRPTILRDQNDARRYSEQRYGYIRDRQLLRNPLVEPTIDELVRDYLGAVPPVINNNADDQIIGPNDGNLNSNVNSNDPIIEISVPQSDAARDEN